MTGIVREGPVGAIYELWIRETENVTRTDTVLRVACSPVPGAVVRLQVTKASGRGLVEIDLPRATAGKLLRCLSEALEWQEKPT